MKDTPMYRLYQRVAPRPEDFPRLLDKIGESMSEEFDFSEEVHGLQVPTLTVAADADTASPTTTSKCSNYSAEDSATVAGSARAGRRAVMRWRSCRD
jgi:hypothetical protein